MESSATRYSLDQTANKQADTTLSMITQEWRGSLFTMERNNISPTQIQGLKEEIANNVYSVLKEIDPSENQNIILGSMTLLRNFLQSKEIIGSINPEGLIDLVRIAYKACINVESLSDLEIRIGYGAADQEDVNVRALSYVVPAIRILKSITESRSNLKTLSILDQKSETSQKEIFKIRKSLGSGRLLSEPQRELLRADQEDIANTKLQTYFPNNLPKVVIYSAHNFVAGTNTVDAGLVNQNVQRMQQLIGSLITTLCPEEIANQFVFDKDVPVQKGSSEDIYIQYIGEVLKNANTPEEEKIRDQIINFGVKKSAGNIEGSLQYGAAHTLYSGDPLDGPPINILEKSSPRPNSVIMIGGPPEQYFWRARNIVMRNANKQDTEKYFAEKGVPIPKWKYANQEYLRAQLITEIGELPVYGKGFDGEWEVQEIAEGLPFNEFLGGTARSSMRADVLNLLAEIEGIDCSKIQRVAKRKETDANILAEFERGYTKLQSFLLKNIC